jgi:hypothetical protein
MEHSLLPKNKQDNSRKSKIPLKYNKQEKKGDKQQENNQVSGKNTYKISNNYTKSRFNKKREHQEAKLPSTKIYVSLPYTKPYSKTLLKNPFGYI